MPIKRQYRNKKCNHYSLSSLEKKRCSEYYIKNKVSEFSLKIVMLYTGMSEGGAILEDTKNPNG